MTKEEISQQVIRELSFIYDEEISEQTTFADLDMDPLDMAELLGDMEQRFGVKLNGEPETVEELANSVNGGCNEKEVNKWGKCNGRMKIARTVNGTQTMKVYAPTANLNTALILRMPILGATSGRRKK